MRAVGKGVEEEHCIRDSTMRNYHKSLSHSQSPQTPAAGHLKTDTQKKCNQRVFPGLILV